MCGILPGLAQSLPAPLAVCQTLPPPFTQQCLDLLGFWLLHQKKKGMNRVPEREDALAQPCSVSPFLFEPVGGKEENRQRWTVPLSHLSHPQRVIHFKQNAEP